MKFHTRSFSNFFAHVCPPRNIVISAIETMSIWVQLKFTSIFKELYVRFGLLTSSQVFILYFDIAVFFLMKNTYIFSCQKMLTGLDPTYLNDLNISDKMCQNLNEFPPEHYGNVIRCNHSMLRQDLNKKSKARELKFQKIFKIFFCSIISIVWNPTNSGT